MIFLVQDFELMIKYKHFYHRNTVTAVNFNKIGIVALDDMGTLPFFSVHYKGKHLPIKSEKKKECAETNGDCFKFVTKFLKIKWKNAI